MRRSQFFRHWYDLWGVVLLACLALCLVGGVLRWLWIAARWLLGW